MMLPQIACIAWAIWMSRRPRWRWPVLTGLWLLLCIGYADNWDFSRYQQTHRQRNRTLQCVTPLLRRG